jgi:hypothetical protein
MHLAEAYVPLLVLIQSLDMLKESRSARDRPCHSCLQLCGLTSNILCNNPTPLYPLKCSIDPPSRALLILHRDRRIPNPSSQFPHDP